MLPVTVATTSSPATVKLSLAQKQTEPLSTFAGLWIAEKTKTSSDPANKRSRSGTRHLAPIDIAEIHCNRRVQCRVRSGIGNTHKAAGDSLIAAGRNCNANFELMPIARTQP